MNQKRQRTDKRNRFCVSLRIGAVQEEEEEERVYFPSPFLVNFSKTEEFLQLGSLVAKSDQVDKQKVGVGLYLQNTPGDGIKRDPNMD